MNISAPLVRHCFIAVAFSTTLGCLLFAAPAFAADGEGSKTRSGWSWIFGNSVFHNTGYGENRTKGSGVIKEESRALTNFSQLTLSLPATVTLSQGPTESLTITADDNILPLLSTRVVNNELLIEGDRNRGFSTTKEIRIRLTVKSLNSLKIKGSGDVLSDQFKGDKLDIAIEGSGDVKFKEIRADQLRIAITGSGDVAIGNVESQSIESKIQGSGDIRFGALRAGQVSITLNGSGDISAAGSADKVAIEISGSGDVRARKLIAREVDVRVAASGDADVHATEKITARVTGSGEIRYAGSPKKVDQVVKGSGSIEAI